MHADAHMAQRLRGLVREVNLISFLPLELGIARKAFRLIGHRSLGVAAAQRWHVDC